MTLTRHGHRILGTTIEDENKNMPKARCGGQGVCQSCTEDELRAFGRYTPNRGK